VDADVAAELHREFLAMIGNGGRGPWRAPPQTNPGADPEGAMRAEDSI
jgi:hypothetical protein